MDGDYKWILLKSKGCITGFYYEVPISSPIIRKLAVTSDAAPQSDLPFVAEYPMVGLPSTPISGPSAGLFLSTAILSNLRRVELCRIGNRCTGLLIHYLNGLSTALGQWHPLSTS